MYCFCLASSIFAEGLACISTGILFDNGCLHPHESMMTAWFCEDLMSVCIAICFPKLISLPDLMSSHAIVVFSNVMK